jgi:hypothetical protein
MPAPVYYPMFAVELGLRFDEALHGVTLPQAISTETGDFTIPATLVQLQGKPATPDGLSFKTLVTPTRCTVDMPGFRQAGKFTLEIPFTDMPFEPDIIRACAVRIYGDLVDGADWAKNNTTVAAAGKATRNALVPSTQNEMLVGVADVIRVEHSEKGGTVSIEGRDLRGILIDLVCKHDVLKRLNVDQPIDKVIGDVIANAPVLKTLGVHIDVRADDWPSGTVPHPNAPALMTRVNQKAAGLPPAPPAPAGGTAPAQGSGAVGPMMPAAPPQKVKLWDLISNLCQLVGAIPYFVGNGLRIRPARALYDPAKMAGFDPNFPTPFAGGTPRIIRGADGNVYTTQIRIMTWGRNISSLKRERKLGGAKVPTVVCVSVDTDSKVRGKKGKHIEAQWPPKAPPAGQPGQGGGAGKATTVSPDGSVVQSEQIFVSVPGIRDKARLEEIAHDIREEIGRGELTGSCSTKDLSSLAEGTEDADLLRLRPGDPVQFTVDARAMHSYPPPITDVSDIFRTDPQTLAMILGQRFSDDDLGRVVAYSILGRIRERQNVYRVSNVRFAWDKGSGIGVDFDFQNYIESRDGDSQAAIAAEKAAFKKKGGSPKVQTAPARGAGGVR